jgi:hypothetical protein
MKAKCNLAMYVFLFVFITLLLMQSAPLSAASMEDYCIIPPYVKRDVKPNIMIIMDNAKGMGDAAYTGDYDPTTTYAGYFQSNIRYTYGSNRWYPDASGIYCGNLLNWALTSKYDLLESILVGGISVSRQTNVNTLISVSTSWTKILTYRDSLGQSRTCKFIVNNANIEIKDDTAGSCGYLDTPTPHPCTSCGCGIISMRFEETDTKFAENTFYNKDEKKAFAVNILNSVARETFSVLSHIMDFLIPDAEAAKPLAITGGSSTLSSGTECTVYSVTISASGGTGAGYTWSIIGGSLPPGLSIGASGTPETTIAGTPTASGTYNFTVQVTDSGGATDSKAYSITIADATVTITTTSPMATGTANSWYRSPIVSSGLCTSSTAWSLTSGSLPPGLSLTKDSVCTDPSNCVFVSGTPTTEGTYNFTVQVKDSGSNTATKALSITINPAVAIFSIVTESPLTEATAGSYYITDITTAGYTCSQCCGCDWIWSITSGSLPAGLSLNTGGPCMNGDHVYITGTPTSTGTFSFTVQVTAPDTVSYPCGGGTATKAFSLTVSSAPLTIRSTGNLSVKVCVGTYAVNCTNAPATNTGPPCAESDPTQCVLKSGIVDQIWPQARLGVQDFNKQAGNAVPNISNCIEVGTSSTPDPNFLTAVENAVPIDPTTTLVNAEYTSVDYYANNTAANCDPFRSSESCQKNFVLMITNGVGSDNPPTPSGGAPDVFSDATNCGSSAYKNLTKNACFGYNNDLRNSPTFGGSNLPGRQYVSTYVVNTMGTTTTQPDGTCDPSATPSTTGDILCQAAVAGGGSYYEVTDPSTLREKLILAFQDIIKRAAAGTAASVLASGEGSGANLIQAVFYPRRRINGIEIAWTGRLTNFWYYVDPFFGTSSIYEDNASTDYFNLTNDYKVTFFFDIANEKTMAHRYYDSNGDGIADTALSDVPFEDLNSLWEAGLKLWERTSARTIYTPCISGGTCIGTTGLMLFSQSIASNVSAIEPYFDLPTTDSDSDSFADGDLDHSGGLPDNTDASILIRYAHGEDFPSYTWLRSRTITLGSDTHVWKLGDILNSTPKISSWIPLNNYYTVYSDTSYDNFTKNYGYPDRGVVFAGGNDGMFHAFKLGRLELPSHPVTCTFSSKYEKACLSGGTDLGEELWAFIPENVLPYLKYIKEPGYCHVYTVDLTPYIFDASIGAPSTGDISNDAKPDDGSTWRTVIIGGMRFGGACRNTGSSCTDCVKTPVTDLGYSSYFALDVTDQSNPILLWEFSADNLGFTTTGPAIVRIGPDKAKNGKWFVVFGSGPTGPVSTSDQQFLGRSDQNLRLFIFDLKQGPGAGNANVTVKDTTIANAFAGSMLNSTIDTDLDYQDDALYIGYVKKCTATSSICTVDTWTDGGVLRLQTKESDTPSAWEASQVIDGIGPVTSSVGRLLHKRNGILWLFFGTGRYYFEQLSTVDDQSTRRTLFGIQEPCYSASGLDPNCTNPFSGSLLLVTDAMASTVTPGDIAEGWKIDLDAEGNYTYSEGTPPVPITRFYRAERVITDVLTTTSGLVFFTTYKPYSDVCAYGGKSFIWAVRYNTGGAPGAMLKGIALLQVSTGSIEQIDLSTAFSQGGGRKTSALEGVPPTAQGLSLLSTPPPVKRILHMRER